MFGVFSRPKLDCSFEASRASCDEFAREVALTGTLAIDNSGSDVDVSHVEMIIVAGFRRISLEVPPGWQAFRLRKGDSKQGELQWSLTLDSPLRATAGELYVSVHDQKRRQYEWRLPFTFEIR